jgi:predicted transcriptional regulator
MGNNKLKPIILIFGILTFFIFILSFTVFYTTENFSTTCGCSLPPWVIIVAMSSLGLFVGLITYYILSVNFIKEKKAIEHNLNKFLDILQEEDKKILQEIIRNKGEINQSTLSKKVGLDKVKMSRVISKLEKKKIIRKEKNGMTNKIILDKELIELFKN